MRLLLYMGVSFLLAAVIIVKSLHQRPNLYSTLVFLAQSTANMMILTNTLLLIVGLCFYGLQRLFFGQLRPFETEHLYERAWFAVTETCLAMAMFRADLDGWFFVMFMSLLLGKVWEWIGEGRLEFMNQQSAMLPTRGIAGENASSRTPSLFHVRMTFSMLLGITFDLAYLHYCFRIVTKQAKPDMTVMFGFEFALLTITSVSTASRYVILLIEQKIVALQRQSRLELERARNPDFDEMDLDLPGWEEKGRWMFFLDLMTDFFKLSIYFAFFAILFTFYGLPIHILRDMVITIRSFVRRIADFIRFRNATRDMDDKYPDATREEIAREDLCIICREQMLSWDELMQQQQQQQQEEGFRQSEEQGGTQPPPRSREELERESQRCRPKKLPCGHILHASCLRSWMERQQICPTCRRPVEEPSHARNGESQAAAGGGNVGNDNDRNAANADANAGGTANAGNNGNVNGNANANANANANTNPNANGNANARAAGRPEPRFFNLGPIRIGFGRHRVHAPRPQTRAPPTEQQQRGRTEPNGPSQSTGVAGSVSGIANIQVQLQALEQRISREIETLRVSAEQLRVVGALQEEYQRLAASQTSAGQAQGSPPAPGTSASSYSVPCSSTSPLSNASLAPSPNSSNVRQYVSSPQYPALSAGDPRVPDGLVLPAGWSLLPLTPGQGEQPSEPATTSNEAGSTEATPTEAQASEHLRVNEV